jgi:calcineurin-like phosphoesterase family protein
MADEMTLFLTSDLHLGHENIIRYCDRPYESVSQMNDDLVNRWNEIVEPEDDVIVVGDLAMGRLDESLGNVSRLAGNKMLVPGNHDRMFKTDGARYRRESDRYLSAGFHEILDPEVELALPDGTIALVCHFPYLRDDEPSDGREGRFPEMRPADTGQLLIHGHQHGMWRRAGRMIDVGVDAWAGYPVSAEVIATTFASADKELSPVSWEPRDAAKAMAVESA